MGNFWPKYVNSRNVFLFCSTLTVFKLGICQNVFKIYILQHYKFILLCIYVHQVRNIACIEGSRIWSFPKPEWSMLAPAELIWLFLKALTLS